MNNTTAESALKYFDHKPNYEVKEKGMNGTKYFFCQLYMPKTCTHILKKVRPEKAFVKKREAENHVALIALTKLREKGYLNEHLFPVNLSSQRPNCNDSLA